MIIVIGHRNPDMDAVASAAGYAWLLNATRSDGEYVPARAGEVNAQTAFALSHFGVEAPRLVVDVRPTVGDVTAPADALTQSATLAQAVQRVAASGHPTPVLDDAQLPLGLMDSGVLLGVLAGALTGTNALQTTLDGLLVDLPMAAGVVLHANDAVTDALAEIAQVSQDDFIVVDAADRYLGVTERKKLLHPPRRRLVLVDHNEATQAVTGLDEAEIVEVLDHHRVMPLQTTVPIHFHVEPVGCCATLIAERGGAFPAPIAGLLLSGILSDTLVFKSPTTTPRDRAAALRLARLATVAQEDADEAAAFAAVEAYGAQLLEAGAGLGARTADDIVTRDLKYYDVGAQRVAIAQVEVTNLAELDAHRKSLEEALDKLRDENRLDAALLLVTNVVSGDSRLLVVGGSAFINALPYRKIDDALLDAPGVMSRKKQVFPLVSSTLMALASV